MTPGRLNELKQFYTHDPAIGECVEEIERLQADYRALCCVNDDIKAGSIEYARIARQLESELASTRAELEIAAVLIAGQHRTLIEKDEENARMRQALQEILQSAEEEQSLSLAWVQNVAKAGLGTVVSKEKK